MALRRRDIPPYQTTNVVRAGISYAFSTIWNQRGLESIWYTPYNDTFHGMVAPFQGRYLVHPQYPLTIPDLVVRGETLRKNFKDMGLDFDDKSTEQPMPEIERSNRPTSGRRMVLEDHKYDRAVENWRLRAKELYKERKDYVKSYGEIDNIELPGSLPGTDPNSSIITNASTTRGQGVDNAPDFALGHVRTVDISATAAQRHYHNRAGKKIEHHCCAMIIELKAPPNRFEDDDAVMAATDIAMSEAIDDLAEYCAAYFASKDTGSITQVLALAGVGAAWRWTVIGVKDVPQYDWETRTMLDDREETKRTFRKLFRSPKRQRWFILGTEQSDKELSKICTDYLRPLYNSH